MNQHTSELFPPEGRVIGLTGAGGSPVGEMARDFGRAGARVAVLDVRLEDADGIVGQIRTEGGEAMPLQLDVRHKEEAVTGQCIRVDCGVLRK